MHDLRDEVDDEDMVDRFALDWRTAGLDEATVALLDYTEKLTTEPGSVGSGDMEVLRSHGFDDPGISSATQVVAYFNYINRIAEGLGVSGEDWLGDDGRPRPQRAPGTYSLDSWNCLHYQHTDRISRSHRSLTLKCLSES